MPESTSLIGRSLEESTVPAFEARVTEQAERLRRAIAAGEFDNPDFAVGLEMEVYAVGAPPTAGGRPGEAGGEEPAPDASGEDGQHARKNGTEKHAWQGRLKRLPAAVFEAGATKELGLHNAEINTEPDVYSGAGLARQAAAIEADFEAARAAARDEGRDLVLDAMWTVPPTGGSRAYLGEHHREDGFVVAANMRPDPRYRAIDNDILRRVDGEIPFAVPGLETGFPSILFESLATSIQPHLQIPTAEAFPAYYNTGIRTLGPLLALATNSPFLPPDLYGDVDDPEALVAATHHELRIPVFEQSVNHSPEPKVRVPEDIETATEVVDRVVADDLYAPFLREWIADEERAGLHDEVWEFDYKRSTYWRWLRCVVGGDPVEGAGDERSLRIEYRPLPTQPTVRDVVGLQALTVGLLRGLVAADHPLGRLPWEAAVQSFYAAAEEGLGADLAWVTAAGERTSDSEVVFEEVFEYARRGLAESGVDQGDVDEYLTPIEARVETGVTPSVWKKERVREEIAAGADLPGAIERMQREYVERSRETDTFADWHEDPVGK